MLRKGLGKIDEYLLVTDFGKSWKNSATPEVNHQRHTFQHWHRTSDSLVDEDQGCLQGGIYQATMVFVSGKSVNPRQDVGGRAVYSVGEVKSHGALTDRNAIVHCRSHVFHGRESEKVGMPRAPLGRTHFELDITRELASDQKLKPAVATYSSETNLPVPYDGVPGMSPVVPGFRLCET